VNFNAMVLPHLPNLRARARGLTKNRADADDLVQDTLMRALRYWHTFADRGSGALPWLYRAMFSEFVNQYHARRTRDTKHEASAMEGCTVQTSEVDTAIDHSLPDEIQRALDALPADFRTVIERMDLADGTQEETAQALGIPIGTVQSRSYRARKQLRASLRDYALSVGATAA
jgi:RNA polymerase sigma-70 factor (ECF subfamily)